MKKLSAILLIHLACACGLLDKEPSHTGTEDSGCELSISFGGTAPTPSTRGAGSACPDTNSFILSVTSSSGNILYKGMYATSPQSIMVEPDTYRIRAVSSDDAVPAFGTPIWGDEQYVKLEAGDKVRIRLVCRQVNCGLALKVSPEFSERYPDGEMEVSGNEGSLVYSYEECRTGYFAPGEVAVAMKRDGQKETLFTRGLREGEILKLNLTVAGDAVAGGGISLGLDTARTYVQDTFVEGVPEEAEKGGDREHAFTISQAKAAVGALKVWVGGFIAGGDMSSKSMSFSPPFSVNTHLGIGPKANTGSKEECIAVQLPSGKVRDSLNLVSHPENVGRYIYIKGDIVESYFGITGIKNVTDFSLE